MKRNRVVTALPTQSHTTVIEATTNEELARRRSRCAANVSDEPPCANPYEAACVEH